MVDLIAEGKVDVKGVDASPVMQRRVTEFLDMVGGMGHGEHRSYAGNWPGGMIRELYAGPYNPVPGGKRFVLVLDGSQMGVLTGIFIREAQIVEMAAHNERIKETVPQVDSVIPEAPAVSNAAVGGRKKRVKRKS